MLLLISYGWKSFLSRHGLFRSLSAPSTTSDSPCFDLNISSDPGNAVSASLGMTPGLFNTQLLHTKVFDAAEPVDGRQHAWLTVSRS